MPKKIICTMVAILLMLINPASLHTTKAFGATIDKTVRVAVGEDESLILERMVYTAFKRLGINIVVSNMGMKTAVTSVDNGENAVLATQVDGLENAYNNLLMIPVPISSVKSMAYTKDGFTKPINGWADLKGLKVGCSNNTINVEQKLLQIGVNITKYDNYELLFESLQNGELDVAVAPLPALCHKPLPNGVIEYRELENLKTYTYVNKEHKELVPKLANVYAEMISDGTFDEIIADNVPHIGGEKTVLHISSYNSDSLWESGIVSGINDALANDNTVYYNFPLNLRRVSNAEGQYDLMTHQIRSVFLARSPDIIIVSDNIAFNYIKRYYHKLFKDTPVVFCGVNNFTPDMVADFHGPMTGVTEEISVTETVDDMLKIYPQTKNIYVVNDYLSSGRLWHDIIKEKIKPYENRVNVTYNEDIPLVQICEKIESFGEDTLVLWGTYYQGKTGRYFTEEDLGYALSPDNKRPVFALVSVNVGNGFLGGKVAESRNQGYEAGKIALAILNGVPVDDLPIKTDTDNLNVWMYDYSIAREYNIQTHLFHFPHIAINKNNSLFDSNPIALILIIGFIVMSTVVIFILLHFLRKQEKAKQKADYIASHDHITQLSNRNAFEDRMNHYLKNGEVGGIFLLDLDSFKAINDVYGHPLGDSCLKEVALRLSHYELNLDLAARIGGDEFVTIALGDKQTITQVAEDIASQFQELFIIDKQAMHITSSIGVVMFPQDGSTTEELLRKVDIALYEAKGLGKNQFCFYGSEMMEKITRQASILDALRGAIDADEFHLVFQPEIKISDKSLVAFEALLRLNSSSLGRISPAEFIPIAESNGIIYSLGLWVLEKACLFAKQMYEKGIIFSYVAINVSPSQLSQRDFVVDVLKVLEKTKLSPKLLQLEITEDAYMNVSEENISRLAKLRSLGISIALDDFGTGYSSMKYLVDLPVDTLKIDKSFINEIETDTKQRSVAHFMINTAHAFGLSVIAEGVERPEQLSFLREMGCDVIQGFLHTVPLPKDEFEKYLTDNFLH